MRPFQEFTIATSSSLTDEPFGARSHQSAGDGDVRKFRRWVSLIVAVSIVALIALILLLRGWGGNSPLEIAVIGMTPWLLVLVPIAGVALWRLRSAGPVVLVVASCWLAVSGWLVVATSPFQAIVGCRASPGFSTDDTVTLYTHNVLFQGGDPEAIAESIVAEQADVVVMQEVSETAQQSFLASEALSVLPYRTESVIGPLGGLMILSRWPLVDEQRPWLVVTNNSDATVVSPWGDFRLTNLHTLAPGRPGNVDRWKAQFEELAEVPTSTALVFAGDFNATGDHRQMRTLLDQGWTNAQDAKGCGVAKTWPTFLPFPLLQLDHVIVTDHFEVLDLRIGQAHGSDHRPIVAELRFIDANAQ